MYRLLFCILCFTCISSLYSFPSNSKDLGKNIVTQAKSLQKCKQYQEIYREVIKSSLPFPFDEETEGDLRCPKFQVQFIVGGREAFPDEFPHMVSLMYEDKHEPGKYSHGCGGTLISEEFVLTAAHCVVYNDIGHPAKAILGDISISETKPSRSRKVIKVLNSTIHPEYNPSKGAYHDIALLQLETKLTFGHNPRPSIRPACIPMNDNQNEFHGVTVTGTGWGITKFGSENIPDLLQAVNLTVKSNEVCDDVYQETLDYSFRFPNSIAVNNLLCVGESGKDTCQGDSGGGIVIPTPELSCMHYVLGVTSLGYKCGNNVDGLYTNVAAYREWIENVVWP